MDNQEINTKDLLGIDLGFENCEGMFIPIEALDNLYIKNGEINTYITLHPNIAYKGYIGESPLERIHKFNDITSINLIYKNNDIKYDLLWWENPNPYIMEQENKYQKSQLISWNRLHLEISKDVLKKEIQSMKEQATKLLDQIKEIELSIS
ncbi:hypothetical protein ACOT7R_08865 [Clostridium perfringens]|uniref:hypothetical protein n=1 Tax=Clostridium perfringens TaxID=1502 RepID=UPI003BA8DF4E